MTEAFSGTETGPTADQERQDVCLSAHHECMDLSSAVGEAWPAVPAGAVEQVASQVSADQLKPVLGKLQSVFTARPSLADLPDEALTRFLDSFLSVEATAKASEIEQGRLAIRRYQTELAAEHTGLDLVQAVRGKLLANVTLSETARTSAIVKLEDITALLQAAETAITAPDEKLAFRRIAAAAPINLSATTPFAALSDFGAAIDASDDLSEETKESLQVIFRQPPIKRASQLQAAIRTGRGEALNPDGSKTALGFDAGHQLPLRQGINVYPEPSGRLILTSTLPDGSALKFATGAEAVSSQDIGRKINTAISLSVIRHAGILNVHGQGFTASQGADIIDLDTVIGGHASRFADLALRHFTGNSRGLDDDILSADTIRELRYACAWLKPGHGDLLGSSNGEGLSRYEGADPHLIALGLLDSEGNIGSETQFERIGQFIKANYGKGEPDYRSLLAFAMRQPG